MESRVAMVMMAATMIFAINIMPIWTQAAFDAHKLQQKAVEDNITCILVFGDSSVDPGNNNHLSTTFKSNFPPYGIDFFDGQPTGRFTNGRLPTDLTAETMGFGKMIRGFLDPNLKREDLIYGVSFASAASGYDDLTAKITNVLTLPKQLEYLKHYKIQLRRLIGVEMAEKNIRNGLFILSMGTNDFIQNYFLKPIRSQQFTLEEYEDYLTTCMTKDIKEMHGLGATKLVVVGLPPIGCLPLVKTLVGAAKCVDSYNNASFSLNSKMRAKLSTLKTSLGMKIVFADAYNIIQSAMRNPMKYGFKVTSKGCCGSGTFEFAGFCKGMSTCKNPSEYIFWDAVHPTERMYQIMADEFQKLINDEMLIY